MAHLQNKPAPIIGITPDVDTESDRLVLYPQYVNAVSAAGGVPVIVPPVIDSLPRYLALCDAWILTGGDDPAMEPFGETTHPQAKVIDLRRQQFEVALLEALEARKHVPAFGICLGMQLMALVAGGKLDQHLPDSLETYDLHWGRKTHRVTGTIGTGDVLSHHRQAVVDPGHFEVAARAPDGVIEAIRDRSTPAFRVGVQWHPERTGEGPLGQSLFEHLIRAAADRGAHETPR